MIQIIKTISSISFYPYFNQALEKYLLDKVDQESLILFTWQNDHAWLYGADYKLEDDLSVFEDSDEYPVRRMSNDEPYHQHAKELNFSFLCNNQDISDDNLYQIIHNALAKAETNLALIEKDLNLFGRKIIECSSYGTGSRHCYHGRIRLSYCPDVELEALRSLIFDEFANYFHKEAQPLSGDSLDEALLNTYVKFFASETWLERGEL